MISTSCSRAPCSEQPSRRGSGTTFVGCERSEALPVSLSWPIAKAASSVITPSEDRGRLRSTGSLPYGSGLIRLEEADRVASAGLLLPVAITATIGILGTIRYVVPATLAYFGIGTVPTSDTIWIVGAIIALIVGVGLTGWLRGVAAPAAWGSSQSQVGVAWSDSCSDPRSRARRVDAVMAPEQARPPFDVRNGGSSLSDHSASGATRTSSSRESCETSRHTIRGCPLLSSTMPPSRGLRSEGRGEIERCDSPTRAIGVLTAILVVAAWSEASQDRPAVEESCELDRNRPRRRRIERGHEGGRRLEPGSGHVASAAGNRLRYQLAGKDRLERIRGVEQTAFFRREPYGSGAGWQVGILSIIAVLALFVALALIPGPESRLAILVGTTVGAFPELVAITTQMFGAAFLIAIPLSWSGVSVSIRSRRPTSSGPLQQSRSISSSCG